MSDVETSREIDERAAAWAARALTGGLDGEAQRELDQWLQGDRRRAGAYLKAQAVIAAFDPVEDSAPAIEAPMASARWSRRSLLGGALAASVAGVAGFAGWQHFKAPAFSTDLGEVRTVALEDGSALTLDALSSVRVRFSPERREVRLEQGRVFFAVAHDATRPFVVKAGPVEVRAVGTAFSVSMDAQAQTAVVMREGIVEVSRARAGPPVRLVAQQNLVAPANGPFSVATQNEQANADTFAWREGAIVLDGTTLADAAAQFARYSRYRIELDPGVADLRLTGRFATSDPRGFAQAAALGLGLKAELEDDRAVLKK